MGDSELGSVGLFQPSGSFSILQKLRRSLGGVYTMSKGIAVLVVEDEEMVKKCCYCFLPRINQSLEEVLDMWKASEGV